MRGEMVICFRYSTVQVCRAAFLSVVVRQAAEKIVGSANGGRKQRFGVALERRNKGRLVRRKNNEGSEFRYPQQGLRLFI